MELHQHLNPGVMFTVNISH